MKFLIYPERRRMQDSEIIQWARDRMIDDWIEAHPEADAFEAADRAVPIPSLREAVAKLEDDGAATFQDTRRKP